MHLSLIEVFNAERLSTRQSVEILDSRLRGLNQRTIHLDFSDIVQISRSFADEISKFKKAYKHRRIEIKLDNMNDSVAKMMDLVSQKSRLSHVNVSASTVLDFSAL